MATPKNARNSMVGGNFLSSTSGSATPNTRRRTPISSLMTAERGQNFVAQQAGQNIAARQERVAGGYEPTPTGVPDAAPSAGYMDSVAAMEANQRQAQAAMQPTAGMQYARGLAADPAAHRAQLQRQQFGLMPGGADMARRFGPGGLAPTPDPTARPTKTAGQENADRETMFLNGTTGYTDDNGRTVRIAQGPRTSLNREGTMAIKDMGDGTYALTSRLNEGQRDAITSANTERNRMLADAKAAGLTRKDELNYMRKDFDIFNDMTKSAKEREAAMSRIEGKFAMAEARNRSSSKGTVGNAYISPKKEQYSQAEQAEAAENVQRLEESSFATGYGIGGLNAVDTVATIMPRIDELAMEDAEEWAALHGERNRMSNNKYGTVQGSPKDRIPRLLFTVESMLDAADRGDQTEFEWLKREAKSVWLSENTMGAASLARKRMQYTENPLPSMGIPF